MHFFSIFFCDVIHIFLTQPVEAQTHRRDSHKFTNHLHDQSVNWLSIGHIGCQLDNSTHLMLG